MLAGRLMTTERCTRTWRGSSQPTTAATTSRTTRLRSIFFIMSVARGFLRGIALRQFSGCALNVIRQSHFVDQAELLFDEVDVFFFAFLDLRQQFAGDEILDGFAVADGGAVHGVRLHLPA